MFVKVAVQRDAVALIEQVLERVHPLDSQGPLYAILQVRVVEYDVEAERLGSDRNRLRRATCVRGRRVKASSHSCLVCTLCASVCEHQLSASGCPSSVPSIATGEPKTDTVLRWAEGLRKREVTQLCVKAAQPALATLRALLGFVSTPPGTQARLAKYSSFSKVSA